MWQVRMTEEPSPAMIVIIPTIKLKITFLTASFYNRVRTNQKQGLYEQRQVQTGQTLNQTQT